VVVSSRLIASESFPVVLESVRRSALCFQWALSSCLCLQWALSSCLCACNEHCSLSLVCYSSLIKAWICRSGPLWHFLVMLTHNAWATISFDRKLFREFSLSLESLATNMCSAAIWRWVRVFELSDQGICMNVAQQQQVMQVAQWGEVLLCSRNFRSHCSKHTFFICQENKTLVDLPSLISFPFSFCSCDLECIYMLGSTWELFACEVFVCIHLCSSSICGASWLT
jgi:hypothetical protein